MTRALMPALVLLGGCSLVLPFTGATGDGGEAGTDAGHDAAPDAHADAAPEADVAADADAPAVDADVARESVPRPRTFLARSIRVDLEARRDVNDDGAPESSVADLGEEDARRLKNALDALLSPHGHDDQRLLLHLPRLEGFVESGPIAFQGLDADCPPFAGDDFGRRESYYARASSLDGCGEPLHVFGTAQMIGADLEASRGALPIVDRAPLRGAWIRIFEASDTEQRRAEASGYLTIADLGRASPAVEALGFEDLSLLERLLTGAHALGLEPTSGLSPDVDLDGDGLEQVVLDGDGHVASCLDGDETPIPGAYCWRDDRTADAFSLHLTMDLVVLDEGGAPPFLGGEPRWSTLTDADCTSPPDSSEWGGCEAVGRPCDRFALEEEPTSWGTSRSHECRWDCSSWGPWVTMDRLVATAENVTLFGGASYDGESAIQLVDGHTQARGFRLVDTVSIGREGLSVEARVLAGRTGRGEYPADGWTIVVYEGDQRDWVRLNGTNAGVNPFATGYVLTWRFYVGGATDVDQDYVTVQALRGDGVFIHLNVDGCGTSDDACAVDAEPGLDAETVGVVEQRARLVIVPDDPGTEEDEQLVRGYVVNESGSTLAPELYAESGYPVRVEVGEQLSIGITSATGGLEADVEVPTGDGLVVECHSGPCTYCPSLPAGS